MFDLSQIRPKHPAKVANLLIEDDEMAGATPANPAKAANPDNGTAEISRLARLAAPIGENAKAPTAEISRLAGLAAASGDSAAGILSDLGYSARYITEPADARRAVSDLLNADRPILGLDIETGGLDPLTAPTRCIQIADQATAYVFDLATVEPAALWGLLAGLLFYAMEKMRRG
jgi:hypothetical protein